jgi:transcriptional regulator GlxA family with amidase domain
VTTRRVSVVLFEGFELLDVFGPLQILGMAKRAFAIELVGPQAGPVASSGGPSVVADVAYADAPTPDIVLVPGGIGNRPLLEDEAFLAWLQAWAGQAAIVTSVCTGSVVLACAGLLDGYRATSNKAVFEWVRTLGPDVTWVPEARWVHDRDRWTSSGVSAGIDMALALVAELGGAERAERLALYIEHDWHRDPGWDPFAAAHGLV